MMADHNQLTDAELDKLLAAAGTPVMPLGFEAAMMKRIREGAAASNVVQFPVKAKKQRRLFAPWPLAAALAASLVIGFWLGGQGSLGSLMGDSTETAMVTNHDFGPAGLDELANIDSATDGQS